MLMPFPRRGVCALNKMLPFLSGADGVVSIFKNKVRFAFLDNHPVRAEK
jgi:hypothetical protein